MVGRTKNTQQVDLNTEAHRMDRKTEATSRDRNNQPQFDQNVDRSWGVLRKLARRDGGAPPQPDTVQFRGVSERVFGGHSLNLSDPGPNMLLSFPKISKHFSELFPRLF